VSMDSLWTHLTKTAFACFEEKPEQFLVLRNS
jgi:hypothetical protein